MRRAAAPLLLTLLLVGPALAQTAPEGRPSLAVVQQPRYSPDDFWEYRVTLIGENRTTVTQDQLVRVEEVGVYNGTPAYRIFTRTTQVVASSDPQDVNEATTSNKTTWASQDGLRLLRIEEQVDRDQWNAFFRVLTTTWVNWTFNEPMDVYQFPLLRGDAWIVVTDAFITRQSTLRTHAQGNEPRTVQQPNQSVNVSQQSATQWLRQDVCGRSNNCTPLGDFDVVILVSQSGDATVRDYWSPAAGNLVRREILNGTGRLVETSFLTNFRFQQAPGAVPPPDDGRVLGTSTDQLVSIAGAVVVGVLVAVVALWAWGRRAPAKDAPPPPGPAPGESPPEAPPEAPSEPSSDIPEEVASTEPSPGDREPGGNDGGDAPEEGDGDRRDAP